MSDGRQPLAARIVITLFLLPFLGVSLLVLASPFIRLGGAVWTWAWTPAECTITASEVVDDGGVYSLRLAYRYQAGGATRPGTVFDRGQEPSSNPVAKEALAAALPVGTETTCYVSPIDPADAVLRRGDSSLGIADLAISLVAGLVFFVPLAIVFYAVHWGASFKRLTSDPRTLAQGVVLALCLGCLTIGGLLFFQFVWRPGSLVLAARSWTSAKCQIMHSEVIAREQEVDVRDSAGKTRSVSQTVYGLDLRYRFRFGDWDFTGNRYRFFAHSAGRETNQAIADRYPVGSEVDCWVDPADPSSVVLDRGVGREVLWALGPTFFLAVGLALAALFRRLPSPGDA